MRYMKMSKTARWMVVAAASALFSAGGIAAEETWVCLGDSITHGGSYTGYLQLYWNLRHPGSEIVFQNHGHSGGYADSGIRMLEKDVLALDPARVIVMFGMNDVWREQWESAEPGEKEARLRGDALRRYTERMNKIADLLGERMVVMTPTPYDQYGEVPDCRATPYCNDPGLATCAGICRTLAAERKLRLIELHRPLTAALKAKPESRFCGLDRVHPKAWGHVVMTALIVRQLGESGEVATVRAKASDAGAAFDYAPSALPFPVSDEYRTAEAFYPVTETFNRETIAVDGLAAGEWELRMDDRPVGVFSASELAAGVNIATLDTPNQRLAQAAFVKATRLNEIYVTFRDMRLGEGVKPGATGYYGQLRETYEKWRDRRGELEAEAARLRAELRAVRPAKCRVTVVRSVPSP